MQKQSSLILGLAFASLVYSSASWGIGLSAVSSAAGAVTGSGSAPVSQGVGVAGWAYTHPGGLIPTTFQVANDNTWVANTVSGAITKVGRAITDGQRKQSMLYSKLLTAQTKEFQKILKKNLKARRRAQRSNWIGPNSEPAGYCGNPALGSGIASGNAERYDLGKKLKDADAHYNKSVNLPAQTRNRLVNLKPQDMNASSLLSPGGSISNLDAAQSLKSTLINPHPQINLPDNAKKTAAGQRYVAAKHVNAARRSVLNNTMNQVIQQYSPTMPLGQWAKTAWHQAGHKGTPKGVVKGQISPMALNNLEVSLRAGNPQWYEKVSTEHEDGLLRELVLERAQAMRMRLESLKMQDRIAMMMASMNAEINEKNSSSDMSNLRNAAIQAGEKQ